MIEHIPRWRGGIAASICCVALGIFTGAQSLLAAAVIPLVYVVVSGLSGVTTRLNEQIAVDRSFDGVPVPGERVTVELTLENTSNVPLPDIRVVDGVPDALRVVEGSPRGSASLTPGDETTIAYDVMAVRGDHTFDPPRLQARDATASTRITIRQPVTGDTTLETRVTVDGVPLPQQTMNYTGNLSTESAGEGIEFYGTREYRRGDQLSRIHWQHLAKTGELMTVNYREHKAAKVILVVDARQSTRAVPKPGYPSAVEYSTYAATRLVNGLLDDGHLVGIATFGTTTAVTGAEPPLEWIEPGGGDELKARVSALFDAVLDAVLEADDGPSDGISGSDLQEDEEPPMAPPAEATTDGGLNFPDQFRKYLPPDAQVVVCSPVLDGYVEQFTRPLRAHGHEITVLSPAITAPAETVGGALTGIERSLQLDRLRNQGAHVIDWGPETPLPLALVTASPTTKRDNGNRFLHR